MCWLRKREAAANREMFSNFDVFISYKTKESHDIDGKKMSSIDVTLCRFLINNYLMVSELIRTGNDRQSLSLCLPKDLE